MSKQSGVEFAAEATPPLGVPGLALGAAEVPGTQPGAAGWDAEKTILLPGVTGATDTVWLQDCHSDEWIEIDRFPFSIGRSPDCHARFQDRSFSRKHAVILQVDGGFVIKDAGSLNGVRVNGHKVGRVLLADGDTLELGDVSLLFHLRPAGGVPELTPEAQVRADPAATPDPARDGGVRRRWPLVAGVAVLTAVLAAAVAYKVRVLDRVTVVELGAAFPAAAKASAVGTVRPALSEPTGKAGGASPAPGKPGPTGKVPRGAGQPGQSVAAAQHAVKAGGRSAAVSGPQRGELDTTPAAAQPKPMTVPKPRLAARRGHAAAHRSPVPISAAASTARIEQARTDYLAGHAPQALSALDTIGTSRRHGAAFRERARQLRQKLARVYDDYAAGKRAFERGDRQAGFTRWRRFLSGERALFAEQKSEYANEVMHAVVAEYIARGNKALMAGHLQDAYRDWRHAARIDPASAAAKSLAAADAQAREVYLQGYRLETVDLRRAKARWRKVLELVPPSSPNYTKASAKLRWYAYLEHR